MSLNILPSLTRYPETATFLFLWLESYLIFQSFTISYRISTSVLKHWKDIHWIDTYYQFIGVSLSSKCSNVNCSFLEVGEINCNCLLSEHQHQGHWSWEQNCDKLTKQLVFSEWFLPLTSLLGHSVDVPHITVKWKLFFTCLAKVLWSHL